MVIGWFYESVEPQTWPNITTCRRGLFTPVLCFMLNTNKRPLERSPPCLLLHLFSRQRKRCWFPPPGCAPVSSTRSPPRRGPARSSCESAPHPRLALKPAPQCHQLETHDRITRCMRLSGCLTVASRLQGVKEFSVPVGLDAAVKVDLVVVGSVAVSEKGGSPAALALRC